MNRRDFLKSALTLTALAPFSGIVAQAGTVSEKNSKLLSVKKVIRRRYKNSSLTLPLLGFGMMRLPRLNSDSPEIDYNATKKCSIEQWRLVSTILILPTFITGA